MNYYAQGGLTVEFSVIKMSNVFWNIYIYISDIKDDHLLPTLFTVPSRNFFSLRGPGSRFAGVDFFVGKNFGICNSRPLKKRPKGEVSYC